LKKTKPRWVVFFFKQNGFFSTLSAPRRANWCQRSTENPCQYININRNVS